MVLWRKVLVNATLNMTLETKRLNPPRCKRRVRPTIRCCYGFYAFCSAREAHVPHRPPAIDPPWRHEKTKFFFVFWRGSGENHQITSAQDRGVRLALVGVA